MHTNAFMSRLGKRTAALLEQHTGLAAAFALVAVPLSLLLAVTVFTFAVSVPIGLLTGML